MAGNKNMLIEEEMYRQAIENTIASEMKISLKKK